MLEAGISWGYFFDHSPFEPHCNAHPNNFIILPKEKKAGILAPLDFDFSYEKQNFISTIEENPETFGKYDESLFSSWINQETYELDKALQGEENMSNFSYSEGGTPEKSVLEKYLRD
jgi:hypothetical protein